MRTTRKTYLCAALAAMLSLAACPAPLRADAGNSGREGYARFGMGSVPPPLAPETNYPLPTRKYVTSMVFPLAGNVRGYHDGYNVSRGTYRHTGIDIPANKMHPIVAPFSGIVGFKTQTFWIYGDNGFKCLGTHLNDDTPGTNDNRAEPDFMFAPNLHIGDRVVAGQFIGYVGNSGNATGPHLHFELFAPDGMLIDPIYSLHAATHIGLPRAVVSDRSTRPAPGTVRVEGCIRGWNRGRRVLTMLLVTREDCHGAAFACTFPTYYRLVLPPNVIENGAETAIESAPRDRPLAFDVTESANGVARVKGTPRAGLARRLVFPVERAGSVAAASPAEPITPITPAAPAAPAAPIESHRLARPVGRTVRPIAARDGDIQFANFEGGTYSGWTLTGECWTLEPPDDDTYSGQIHGFDGQRFLSTFHPRLGAAATGEAVSREFTIERPFIKFLIGGGNLPGQVGMSLVVDGRVVRTETGNNRRTLEPASWNVRSLIGSRARIVVFDRSAEPEVGYVMVDRIAFSSVPGGEQYEPAAGRSDERP